MRAILVTGDRHAKTEYWDNIIFERVICARPNLVIVGDASGIDEITRYNCESFDVDFVEVPALWDEYGRPAGPMRNEAMLKILLILGTQGYQIEVMAFHDDIKASKGTRGMCDLALAAGVATTIFESNGHLTIPCYPV